MLKSALALFLATLAPALLAQEAAEVKLPVGARALRDLAYVANGHAQQRLDLYLPARPTGPLLVMIHGGGWMGGSKDQPEGLTLLGRGYAIANIDYRLSQDAIFPAQIEDCKAAIRWLRAQASEYGYDPQRIGVWGASAGGHLAAMLATTSGTREFDVGAHLDQSSAVACAVDIYGPADLPGWQAPSANPYVQRLGVDSMLVRLLGGPVDAKLELARRASPVAWAKAGSAPCYIMHGTADPVVGFEQSRRLADALAAAGAEVIFEVVEGGGHGGPEFWAWHRSTAILGFLERHLAVR